MKVLINGCFDILHRGHLHLINIAWQYGDVIAAVDTDESVCVLKGPGRPVNPLAVRISYLRRHVRQTISFHHNNYRALVEKLKPDYIITGDDHDYDDVRQLAGDGPEIILVPRYNDLSTTRIINGQAH